MYRLKALDGWESAVAQRTPLLDQGFARAVQPLLRKRDIRPLLSTAGTERRLEHSGNEDCRDGRMY